MILTVMTIFLTSDLAPATSILFCSFAFLIFVLTLYLIADLILYCIVKFGALKNDKSILEDNLKSMEKISTQHIAVAKKEVINNDELNSSTKNADEVINSAFSRTEQFLNTGKIKEDK